MLMASSASSIWQSSNPTTLTVQIGNVSHDVPNKMELAVLLNLQNMFQSYWGTYYGNSNI
jgi:hypothetical protein